MHGFTTSYTGHFAWDDVIIRGLWFANAMGGCLIYAVR